MINTPSGLMVLAEIDYIRSTKIDSIGITHIDAGKDSDCWNYLIFDVSLTWNKGTPQIVPSSVKDNSI